MGKIKICRDITDTQSITLVKDGHAVETTLNEIQVLAAELAQALDCNLVPNNRLEPNQPQPAPTEPTKTHPEPIQELSAEELIQEAQEDPQAQIIEEEPPTQVGIPPQLPPPPKPPQPQMRVTKQILQNIEHAQKPKILPGRDRRRI